MTAFDCFFDSGPRAPMISISAGEWVPPNVSSNTGTCTHAASSRQPSATVIGLAAARPTHVWRNLPVGLTGMSRTHVTVCTHRNLSSDDVGSYANEEEGPYNEPIVGTHRDRPAGRVDWHAVGSFSGCVRADRPGQHGASQCTDAECGGNRGRPAATGTSSDPKCQLHADRTEERAERGWIGHTVPAHGNRSRHGAVQRVEQRAVCFCAGGHF